MTIDRAVKILNTHQACLAFDRAPDLRDALKLGIEALQLVKDLGEFCKPGKHLRLAGETE